MGQALWDFSTESIPCPRARVGSMSGRTPPSDTLTHTPAPGRTLSLAQRGNSLHCREDKSAVGWRGKVTQSGRGTLRASLPRSAGRSSALAGVLQGAGRRPFPRGRPAGSHSARRPTARGVGAGTLQQRGGPRVRDPLPGPPPPLEAE